MSCEHGYVNPETDCASCASAPQWEQVDALNRIAVALERIVDLLNNRDYPREATATDTPSALREKTK